MAKLIPFPRSASAHQPVEPPASPSARLPLTRGEQIYHAVAISFLTLLSLPLLACLIWAAWVFGIEPLLDRP
jgi:hypothetical protein